MIRCLGSRGLGSMISDPLEEVVVVLVEEEGR